MCPQFLYMFRRDHRNRVSAKIMVLSDARLKPASSCQLGFCQYQAPSGRSSPPALSLSRFFTVTSHGAANARRRARLQAHASSIRWHADSDLP